MKGDATTHTTNAKYREGWERVFARRPMFKPVYGPGETPEGRDCCIVCGGEVDLAAANNVWCSACLEIALDA